MVFPRMTVPGPFKILMPEASGMFTVFSMRLFTITVSGVPMVTTTPSRLLRMMLSRIRLPGPVLLWLLGAVPPVLPRPTAPPVRIFSTRLPEISFRYSSSPCRSMASSLVCTNVLLRTVLLWATFWISAPCRRYGPSKRESSTRFHRVSLAKPNRSTLGIPWMATP
ncbi:hypothetical protein D3C76_1375100 [compost metagenome]